MSTEVAEARKGAASVSVATTDEQLATLYTRHASDAARLAYLLTGDRQAAEDIAHEAFARLGGRIRGLREPDKAAGYLFRTVANLSRGHGRAVTRDRKLLRRIESATTTEQPDLGNRDQLWRAFMKLSQRHRTVLYLRYYLGFPEAEAAEALGLSISAVKSLTNRAAKACRKHLSEEEA